ncbi:MAG: hypothetical protein QOE90_3036 [Thermoplasmata archaeon]|jgi:hypothetical protein|nr:hypothetical protein [Thermoplasmata archaeon]
METREKAYVVRYTFTSPTVERVVRQQRHFIVLQALVPGWPERRFEVQDEAILPALREEGVPLETEDQEVVELVTPNSWFERVAAFLASLPPDVRERVSIDAWRNAHARTSMTLGIREHDRAKAHLEEFFREQGVEYIVSCGTELSASACQPIPPDRIARLTGART